MPRRPIDLFWKTRVRALLANADGGKPLSDKAIAERLGAEAAKLGRSDWPSARSIGRMRDEWKNTPEQDRAPYREVYWPESMGSVDLPWDASASVLELLRASARRPDVRVAKWFWRVSTGAPDAPLEERAHMARTLAAQELVGDVSLASRSVEAFLRYRPWTSETARKLMNDAHERGEIPLNIGVTYTAGTTLTDYAAALRLQFGDLRPDLVDALISMHQEELT